MQDEKGLSTEVAQWYAIQTRAKHERRIATDLQGSGIVTFVPAIREVHRWSDRRKIITTPLFLCYVFAQTAEWRQVYMRVLRTPGVLRWVGANGAPASIPSSELDAIRSLLKNDIPLSPHAYLRLGERVRIRGGALDGIEGVLTGRMGDSRLVISVELIRQSMALSLDGYDVEPVDTARVRWANSAVGCTRNQIAELPVQSSNSPVPVRN